VRLCRAQELLAEAEMPIATIAERCGFGCQEYLGFVFRARTGLTPTSYRRQARRDRTKNHPLPPRHP
jgi:transcriptional regulator GlxA family with amidase domain